MSPPVSDVIISLSDELQHRKLPFLVLDPRGLGEDFELSWALTGNKIEGTLSTQRRDYDLKDVRSILAYLPTWPIPDETGQYPNDWPLLSLCESFPGLVVNRPHTGSSNGSKPFQQTLIEAQGFRTPPTFISWKSGLTRDFFERSNRDLIYKSISWVRSIVSRFEEGDLERLEESQSCPLQLQERIPGVDVRVHVVGDRVFATEVESQALDYRYAKQQGKKRTMRPVSLPEERRQACVDLAKSLGMSICGVDLRRTPDHEYYCFEVNPTPGYSFYQQYTGQGITEALVDLLEQGEV